MENNNHVTNFTAMSSSNKESLVSANSLALLYLG